MVAMKVEKIRKSEFFEIVKKKSTFLLQSYAERYKEGKDYYTLEYANSCIDSALNKARRYYHLAIGTDVSSEEHEFIDDKERKYRFLINEIAAITKFIEWKRKIVVTFTYNQMKIQYYDHGEITPLEMDLTKTYIST